MSFASPLIKFYHWLEGNKFIAGLLLFLIAIIFFAWLQRSPVFSDPDSFYHLKMAQLISDQGLITNFPYLPLTVFSRYYANHHLLYHLLLVPFIRWLPPPVGIKLAQIIFSSLVILVFFWLLLKLNIRGAFWYTSLLFLCEAFIFRLNLVKAQSLSLILIFGALYLILRQKYWSLFFLSFIYVWAHGSWFLLLILAILYILLSAFERIQERRDLPWPKEILKRFRLSDRSPNPFFRRWWRALTQIDQRKLFFSVLSGLAAGLVINPYFPMNLKFYWFQIVQIGLINFQSQIGVGNEWYPYSFFQLWRNLILVLPLAASAALVYLYYRPHFNLAVKYLLGVMILFFLATIKARRNIEYLIPLMIIFSAAVFSASLKIRSARRDLKYLADFLKEIFNSHLLIKVFLILTLIATSVAAVWQLPLKTKRALGSGFHFNYLRASSEYLKNQVPVGTIIFHSGWDRFPSLFYHNHYHYYIIGLDPTFLYLSDPELYEKWRDITLGKRGDEIYQIIKEDFGANYVLVTKNEIAMIDNLERNFYFIKVYEDEEAIIYRVL